MSLSRHSFCRTTKDLTSEKQKAKQNLFSSSFFLLLRNVCLLPACQKSSQKKDDIQTTIYIQTHWMNELSCAKVLLCYQKYDTLWCCHFLSQFPFRHSPSSSPFHYVETQSRWVRWKRKIRNALFAIFEEIIYQSSLPKIIFVSFVCYRNFCRPPPFHTPRNHKTRTKR